MSDKNLLPLPEGAAMTKIFRDNRETILADEYKNKKILPTCETFDREAFDTLLKYNNVKSIRIYSCMDSELKMRFIIVGVNGQNEDVYINDDQSQDNKYVIEVGLRCPDSCPPTSTLNG